MHDQDEALEIIRARLQEVPLAQVLDEIVLPSLISARTDYDHEALSEIEMAAVLVTVRELIEELATEPDSAPEEAKAAQRLTILGCWRDVGDEAALEMLQRIVDPSLCRVEIVSTDRLVSEVVGMVAEERPVDRLYRLSSARRIGPHAATVQANAQPLPEIENCRGSVGTARKRRTQSRVAHLSRSGLFRDVASRNVDSIAPTGALPADAATDDREDRCGAAEHNG